MRVLNTFRAGEPWIDHVPDLATNLDSRQALEGLPLTLCVEIVV